MTKYLVRRLLQSLLVFAGALLISFLLMRIIPGNAAQLLAGESATPQEIAVLEEQLGVNRPIWEQLVYYLRDICRGEFGYSLRRGVPALELFLSFLPATLELAAAALALTVVIALPLGVISALRHNKLIDHVCMALSIIGQSMPTYWIGILLILLFAVNLGVLPTSGYGDWTHLVMPAFTLAAAHVALLMRMTRSSMLEVLSQDYIRTARAKGLLNRGVIFRHALKNAMIPSVTILGLQLGNLLGGSIITEKVFGWPGVGSLIVDSIAYRDYPVIQVAVLASAVIIVAVNFIADMVYMLLDPRIAYK